jgi:hypothetical protein
MDRQCFVPSLWIVKTAGSPARQGAMMTNFTRNLMTTTAITLAGAGAFAGVASATTSTGSSPSRSSAPASASAGRAARLATVKEKAAEAINRRVAALDKAVSDVNANRFLSAADKAALLTTLDADLTGLAALGPVIQGDPTAQKARADYRTIFTSYRVFALAVPQVRFAESADDLTGGVLPKLTDAHTRLETLLSGSGSARDTPAVQAAMADLSSQISSIASAINGVSSTVLGYTPSDWNADRALLSGPRAALVAARGDARKARSDITTVVKALK